MKQFFTIIILFFFSFAQAGEFSGNYYMVGKISEKCDFIGNAELAVNYNVIKIKVEKWRWLDTNEFIKTKPKICKTSGRLYRRKEGITYIFGDWSLDDEGNIDTFGNVTVIPNVLIKEIKVIK